MLPSFFPARPAVRRKRRTRGGPTPPAILTLAAASYDPDGLTLTMQFDRAIDVSAFNGSDITVADGTYNTSDYAPLGAVSLIDPATVQIGLIHLSGEANPGVFLSAAGDNGIVAVDDGGTWGGCSEVELPFG